jgi:predicted DNA-binding transcriptional regulator AlpA
MTNEERILQELQELRADLVNTKRILSFGEGCKFLGIAESYGYKLTSTGILPHSKPLGKMIYFDKEQLIEWALSNRIKTQKDQEEEAATYIATHPKK